MLGSDRVGVDNGLIANLVCVLVVLQVVVSHIGGRVVDAPNLAFLTDLYLGHDRVDRGGGVVDVRNRAGGRHRLQVTVVQAVLTHLLGQLSPIFTAGHVHTRSGKQFLYTLSGGHKILVQVLFKELAGGVLRFFETNKTLIALAGQLAGGLEGLKQHAGEVNIGEVQGFLAAVVDGFARQETV